jgi:hypothetical protein
MPRTIWAACATGLLLAALLSVPGPAAAHAPAQPDLIEDDVLAEAQGSEPAMSGGTAKVNQLDLSTTAITVLDLTMHNEGTDGLPFAVEAIGQTYLYVGGPQSGITLLDTVDQTRYHPLMDEETRCLCSAGIASPMELVTLVPPDSYTTYHSTFLLPEDVDEVTVEVPGFDPIEEVPVTHL